MLKIVKSFHELKFGALMAVYLEGNQENGEYFYPNLPKNEQLLQAEQDAYTYLKDCFFKTPGAEYMIWEQEGFYVAALRLEPYQDGLLLEALETAPNQRQKGYASALIQAVQAHLTARDNVRVYSHVSKRNIPSLKVHKRNGFRIILDHGTDVDGSVTQNEYTLCWESPNNKTASK